MQVGAVSFFLAWRHATGTGTQIVSGKFSKADGRAPDWPGPIRARIPCLPIVTPLDMPHNVLLFGVIEMVTLNTARQWKCINVVTNCSWKWPPYCHTYFHARICMILPWKNLICMKKSTDQRHRNDHATVDPQSYGIKTWSCYPERHMIHSHVVVCTDY